MAHILYGGTLCMTMISCHNGRTLSRPRALRCATLSLVHSQACSLHLLLNNNNMCLRRNRDFEFTWLVLLWSEAGGDALMLPFVNRAWEEPRWIQTQILEGKLRAIWLKYVFLLGWINFKICARTANFYFKLPNGLVPYCCLYDMYALLLNFIANIWCRYGHWERIWVQTWKIFI